MAISSPGVGSNLDVNGIVSQLMAVEQKPLTALARKEATQQNKMAAYGALKGSLTALQGALSGLSDASKFQQSKNVAVNDTAQAGLVRDPAKATIYDGRDNEELKAKFFAAVLGVPLTVVLLDQ